MFEPVVHLGPNARDNLTLAVSSISLKSSISLAQPRCLFLRLARLCYGAGAGSLASVRAGSLHSDNSHES